MKTLVHIVGNRPQFIKLSVLYEELKNNSAVRQQIIHTGQHSSAEMSDIFFQELHIPQPDVYLNISNTGTTDEFIGAAATALQRYFTDQKNLLVFVYGDTNTTMAAALAARRSGCHLLHFEAGVRTGDAAMPEEINRLVTDRLADTNFCCTERNFSTMLAEGYSQSIASRLFLTGDLLYDAFLKIPAAATNITREKKYLGVTIHRAANLGNLENLTEIIEALNTLHKEIPVIMPMHPHTRKKILDYGLAPSFQILPPCGYAEMKRFIINAEYLITDSGGSCREAYFAKKKSVIVMPRPFWPEITEKKCAVSVNANKKNILEAFAQLPRLDANFESCIFGQGNAASKIRDIITHQLEN